MKTMMLYNLSILKRNALVYGLSCLFVVVVMLMVAHNGADLVSTVMGIVMFLLVYTSLLLVTTISMDRYDHGLNQIFLLPLSREQYVFSKYIEVYGSTMILFGLGASTLLFSGNTNMDYMLMLIPVTCLSLVLTSIQIPIYFKVDLSKARFVTMAVYAILFLVLYFGFSYVSTLEIDFDIIRSMVLTNTGLVLIVVLAITALINMVSIVISIKFVEGISD